MGEGKEENAIVTSTGEYVVAWDFAKVKKGQLDKYEIKKCVCHSPSASASMLQASGHGWAVWSEEGWLPCIGTMRRQCCVSRRCEVLP